jgi:hypothetical protein
MTIVFSAGISKPRFSTMQAALHNPRCRNSEFPVPKFGRVSRAQGSSCRRDGLRGRIQIKPHKIGELFRHAASAPVRGVDAMSLREGVDMLPSGSRAAMLLLPCGPHQRLC